MDEKTSFGTRLKHAWNAFTNKDPTDEVVNFGTYSSYGSRRPDRVRFTRGNERSITASIYNRIAMDVAAIDIMHVQLDENKRFLHEVDSKLNNCLTIEANIDQTGRALIQDAVMSMFDEGVIAIVPVDTTIDPNVSGSYDIESLRVGKIVEWQPRRVKVKLYNDRTGFHQEVWMDKANVAIIENPLYAIVNDNNSVMQRLVRKLNLLDAVDAQSGSGKLDIIIQLPYTIKGERRREQAENRRKNIEDQLSTSQYGVAYADATEKITQLNRPVESNLIRHIEYLTNMAYAQLGITQSIMDGTADEKTMLNYNNRTVEPIISAITDEMTRKFLTKAARTQRKSIAFFRDPFRLVPVSEIAEIADKFTRNEIASSNDIRQVIGWKPSSDPKADELRNKNLSQSTEELQSKLPNVDTNKPVSELSEE